MKMSIPTTVERSHQELLGLLVAAQRLPGKTGVVAEELAKNLQPHLDREEECALPLLGLLQTLVTRNVNAAESGRATKLYTQMKKEYPRMTREHKELHKLIEQLKKVGAEEGHLTAVRFAEKLERHTQDDEELLYPAALLAGRLASKDNRMGTRLYGPATSSGKQPGVSNS